jgi:polyhydroxyalkanoate synthesis regulator phasin
VRSRTARIVALVAVVATSFAACSDGQSKDDFIAAADEACREADDAIREIGRPRVGEGVLDYVEQAEDVSSELVSDLRALDPPQGDADEIDRMIDGFERATDLLEPLAQATVDRDAEAVEELQQEVQQTTDEISEIAESYGFEVCGAKVLDPIR